MSMFTSSSAVGMGVPNYSYFSIPVGWVLCMIPHWFAVARTRDQFNIANPRQLLHDLLSKKNRSEEEGKILRAEAAQLNGFETLGLFAAAVVAANLAKVPNHELNRLAAAYLVSRALFDVLYIVTTTEATARLRSASYMAGVGIVCTLFIKAGRRSI